jgi:hypothetical protein
MKGRAARDRLQIQNKSSPKRLFKLSAQTYERYVAQQRSKDRKKVQSKEEESSWIVKPAY